MGNKCTTAKYDVVLPAKRGQIGISPFPRQNSTKESFSATRKNKISETKNSLDNIPNIGSLSAFSSRTRGSTCDLGCEETPQLVHTSSTDSGTNGSPTFDNASTKKTFQYKKGPLIGKGSYGEVNECLNLSSGEIIAAKSVKVYGDLAKLRHYVEALKKEILVLKGLTHPNVVKYLAIETSENKEENYSQIEIVSEYVSGGSIKVLLEKFNKLDERVVSSYTKQILEGLDYLHENEIVHRNIKSSNVLIDAYGVAKLTDFGCFKSLDKFVDLNSPGRASKSPSVRLSSCWEAPEVVMKKSQGKPSDIWSVGCVVLEMLTGFLPWASYTANMDNLCKLITSGTLPPFPEHTSENCKDFLSKCFRYKPEDRPPAEELLDHPFIRETLPSLSCLDLDPQHHYQPSLIVKSIDLLQDDIFRDDTQPQQKCDSVYPPKTDIEELDKSSEFNTTEPPTHLGQNKVIRSNSNMPASPLYPTQLNLTYCPKNLPENSIEVANTSVTLERLPSLRIKQSSHFEPKDYRIRNSPSPRIRVNNDESFRKTNQLDVTTPIKNSFFSYSNSSIQRSNEDKEINKTQEISPKIREQQRQESEEKMAQDPRSAMLESKEHNKENLYRQKEKSRTETRQLSDEEKRELRRKFEQEMEQDLLNVNQSVAE